MSGPYEIRYLSTAEADLEEIFDYIVRDDPSSAASMLEQFHDPVSKLADNPHLGVAPGDDLLKRLGYRLLIIGDYLVFYVAMPKMVQIRRILHGARNYRFLL